MRVCIDKNNMRVCVRIRVCIYTSRDRSGTVEYGQVSGAAAVSSDVDDDKLVLPPVNGSGARTFVFPPERQHCTYEAAFI